MKRKLLMILAGLFFLCGLSVFLYPTVQTAAFRQAEKSVIRRFEEYRAEEQKEPGQAVDTPEDSLNPDSTPPTEPLKAFPALWEACVRYNTLLPETQGSSLTAQGMRVPALDLAEYGWEQEVFACLSIPSADIETPLYLGADSTNLNRGGAILGQTSNIDRKVFSTIRCKKDYKPKKKTALAFAIALELDLPTTLDLLSRAEYTFSPSSKFDLIVTYFITNKKYNIFEINAALFQYGLQTLGE